MADMTTKILTVELQADKAINGIVSLNDAISKNTQQIKDNNAMIAENNKAMKEDGANVMKLAAQNQKLSQSNAELEAKTKVLKDERRLLQKETQNEIRLQTQEQGSLRQLRAELSNLTKQYDSLSRAERENVNVGGRLKNQINQVTTEIKAAEEGTQRYYRNVGNYQNAILGAIGINGRFGQSITNIINMEGGVKGAMASMEASAKAFGRTLMGLMTRPVFLAIAGIAGAGVAAKWFYDYNMGIEQALRLTREFTGLAGSDLANLRAEIAATAEIYGKDYKEVLEAVDMLMANYGKTDKEAIDIINAGFQSGADLNGDMLGKMQQYGASLHDAGIEADQLVALLQQTRSGIFTDQGLDAIRMGSTRLREMSATTSKALQQIGIDVGEMQRKLANGTMETFDGLQMVAKKLQELPRNSKEYGEVITQVFGRQGRFAAQEMIEGLAGINTSLEDLKKTTGEYGELTDQLREKERELQSAMADVFGTGEDGFESLTLQAKIFVKDGLIQIVKWLQEQVSWFKNVWNSTQAVRVALAGFIALWRILSKVAYAPISLILNGLKTIGDVLVVLSNALKAIKTNIANAFKGLVEIFRGIKNLDPEQVWAGVQQAANGAWESVKSATAGMVNSFGAAFSNIKGMAVDTASDIKDIWQDSFDIANYKFPAASASASGGAGGDGSTSGRRNDGTGSSSTSGGSSSSGGKGKSGASKKSASSTIKSGKTPAELAQEAYNKRIEQLVKQGESLHKKALEEQTKENLAAIEQLAEMERQALYKQYGDRSQYEGEALAAWDAMWQEIEDRRTQRIKDYNENIRKQEQEQSAKTAEFAQKYAQTMVEALPEGSVMQKEWQLEQLRLQMDAELAMYENNEQMKMAIQSKYGLQMQQVEQQFLQNQLNIQKEKYDAIAGIVGGLGQVFGEFGDESREMAILQKTLALGEIMIAQAVAIANAVKAGSNAITPWQMIAQIATSIVAVTTAMAQAFKSLDSAKFATGGYIRGAGTSTSDSIPVRVSNGESIMNANTTAMFSGLLSSLNQLGGGVPIQVQQTAQNVRGEDMLARAFAKGVAMLPNPVVSVVDINNGQRQVEVVNERATL